MENSIKNYPTNLPKTTEQLLSLNIEQIRYLDEQVQKTTEHNFLVRKACSDLSFQKIEDIKKMLALKDISCHISTRKKSSRGYKTVTKNKKWFDLLFNEIISQIPNTPWHPLQGVLFTTQNCVYEYKDSLEKIYVKLQEEELADKKREERELVLLTEAQKILRDNNIDFVGMTTEVMQERAIDFESKKMLKAAEGQKFSFDQCGNCDTYVLGERRCSCGNRRVNAFVDGNLIDGLYINLEAY